MENAYKNIISFIEQAKKNVPNEFHDTVKTVADEQSEQNIQELINFISQNDTRYTTYSHS